AAPLTPIWLQQRIGRLSTSPNFSSFQAWEREPARLGVGFAEVVHGVPYRFTDQARFSFAHGGKDRHPFPVPLRVYDQTIQVLKSAVRKAKLGRDEELAAIERLDAQARGLERHATGPSVDTIIADERGLSHSYGGR